MGSPGFLGPGSCRADRPHKSMGTPGGPCVCVCPCGVYCVLARVGWSLPARGGGLGSQALQVLVVVTVSQSQLGLRDNPPPPSVLLLQTQELVQEGLLASL